MDGDGLVRFFAIEDVFYIVFGFRGVFLYSRADFVFFIFDDYIRVWFWRDGVGDGVRVGVGVGRRRDKYLGSEIFYLE